MIGAMICGSLAWSSGLIEYLLSHSSHKRRRIIIPMTRKQYRKFRFISSSIFCFVLDMHESLGQLNLRSCQLCFHVANDHSSTVKNNRSQSASRSSSKVRRGERWRTSITAAECNDVCFVWGQIQEKKKRGGHSILLPTYMVDFQYLLNFTITIDSTITPPFIREFSKTQLMSRLTQLYMLIDWAPTVIVIVHDVQRANWRLMSQNQTAVAWEGAMYNLFVI